MTLKEMSAVLRPEGEDVVNSGDAVADNNAREDFTKRYDQMHRLGYNDKGQVILYVGADNWPPPIPIVKKGDGWVSDKAGRQGGIAVSPRRPQRALHHRRSPGTRGCAAGLQKLAAAIRAEDSQRRRAEERPVLAYQRRRAREPDRTSNRRCDRRRLQARSKWKALAVSRLLLQGALEPELCCTRRRAGLYRRWQDDPWLPRSSPIPLSIMIRV
jgi:Protein of unknown function (DUF2950)